VKGAERVKTLLIDMDSVIVDLMSEWCRRYNADYNDCLTPDQILTWDWPKYVKPECGHRIYHYLDEPGIFSNLQPLPGAIEVLERLHRHFEVLIVTSSRRSAFAQKEEWVEKHLPFIGTENLIFAHKKHKVCGDLLFDDAPHNLIAFIRTGRIGVAMDYAYNRQVDCPRVSDWHQFEKLVDSLWHGEGLRGE
jgi:5'-nucleotidase